MAQRVILTVSVPLILAACATVGPPQPPSLELPKPPTDLRASRKGNRVNLTWSIPTMTTDRETVRGLGPTLVCRGLGELSACNTPAGEVRTPIPPSKAGASTQKPQGSYTDSLPPQMQRDDPSAFTAYAVQVLNREGRAAGLSNQVHVPLAHTLPPPREFQVSVAKVGVVLSWMGDIAPVTRADVQYIYRIYRRTEGSDERAVAGETAAGAETSFIINDTSIEWEKTYYYSAEAVTQIRQANNSRLDVEGDETQEIKVFADDLFPPAVPTELQAVFSGPGQKPFIDLVWSPVTDADLAGYNVYRREEGTTPAKLNAELIKAPAYRDENVAAQKKYFYSVSAVDARGNESARSEEANETVP